jgi:hypothetical protein
MVRQITIEDFPSIWQEERAEKRSHDSRGHDTRVMLRLAPPSRTKLQELVDRFDVSKAGIIRRLITQATLEDFPKGWHMMATGHSVPPIQPHETRHDRDLTR